MNCYDCPDIVARPAVAVCMRCGAAICREHANESHTLAQDITGTGRATHGERLRHITCLACHKTEVS